MELDARHLVTTQAAQAPLAGPLGALAPWSDLPPGLRREVALPPLALAPAPARPLEVTGASAPPVQLSRGLAQVLNACLIDQEFCEAFLAAPALAAVRAIRHPETTFGCTLPDPLLTLPALALEDGDLLVLRQLPRLASLADAARHIVLLTSDAGTEGAPPGGMAAAA